MCFVLNVRDGEGVALGNYTEMHRGKKRFTEGFLFFVLNVRDGEGVALGSYTEMHRGK